MERLRIGELLLQAKLITPERLDDALVLQKAQGRKLGQVLIDLGLVNETQVTQALGQQLSVPWVSLYHIDFSRQLLNLVPREIAERYCLIPIYVRRVRKQGDTLYCAMDDPTNEPALEAVRQSSGLPVRPMIAASSDIRSAIRVYYETGEQEAQPLTAPDMAVGPGGPLTVRSSGREVLPLPRLDPAPPPPDAPNPPPPPPPRPAAPPAISVATEEPSISESVAPAPSSDVDVAPGVPPTSPSKPELLSVPPSAVVSESEAPPSEAPVSDAAASDSPDAWPEVEARTMELPVRKGRTKMVSVTLLDGTTIKLPAKPRRGREEERQERAAGPQLLGDMTARDLIAALHAVAQGADAAEVFGERVPIEAICATILSLLLRKGLVADWEFVEEIKRRR